MLASLTGDPRGRLPAFFVFRPAQDLDRRSLRGPPVVVLRPETLRNENGRPKNSRARRVPRCATGGGLPTRKER